MLKEDKQKGYTKEYITQKAKDWFLRSHKF